MIRPPIVLRTPTLRQFAASYIMEAAPDNCVVQFVEDSASDAQKRLMHSMAYDLSKQVPWCGRKMSVEEWKRFCTAKLKKDRFVFDCDEFGQPDPTNIVSLGCSTRDKNTAFHNAMIEWFEWMGAQHGVEWTHEKKKAAAYEEMKR